MQHSLHYTALYRYEIQIFVKKQSQALEIFVRSGTRKDCQGKNFKYSSDSLLVSRDFHFLVLRDLVSMKIPRENRLVFLFPGLHLRECWDQRETLSGWAQRKEQWIPHQDSTSSKWLTGNSVQCLNYGYGQRQSQRYIGHYFSLFLVEW